MPKRAVFQPFIRFSFPCLGNRRQQRGRPRRCRRVPQGVGLRSSVRPSGPRCAEPVRSNHWPAAGQGLWKQHAAAFGHQLHHLLRIGVGTETLRERRFLTYVACGSGGATAMSMLFDPELHAANYTSGKCVERLVFCLSVSLSLSHSHLLPTLLSDPLSVFLRRSLLLFLCFPVLFPVLFSSVSRTPLCARVLHRSPLSHRLFADHRPYHMIS